MFALEFHSNATSTVEVAIVFENNQNVSNLNCLHPKNEAGFLMDYGNLKPVKTAMPMVITIWK